MNEQNINELKQHICFLDSLIELKQHLCFLDSLIGGTWNHGIMYTIEEMHDTANELFMRRGKCSDQYVELTKDEYKRHVNYLENDLKKIDREIENLYIDYTARKTEIINSIKKLKEEQQQC